MLSEGLTGLGFLPEENQLLTDSSAGLNPQVPFPSPCSEVCSCDEGVSTLSGF